MSLELAFILILINFVCLYIGFTLISNCIKSLRLTLNVLLPELAKEIDDLRHDIKELQKKYPS